MLRGLKYELSLRMFAAKMMALLKRAGLPTFKRAGTPSNRKRARGLPFHGRHIDNANISAARGSSIRKLQRGAKRGQIDLTMPGAKAIARHEWPTRPKAARS